MWSFVVRGMVYKHLHCVAGINVILHDTQFLNTLSNAMVTRYAFANIDVKVARVFLSKNVALPFLRFRMWRHAPRTASQVLWKEVEGASSSTRK